MARRRRRLAGGAAVEVVAASWLTDGGSGSATAVSHGSSSFPGLLLLFRFLEFPIGFKFSQASQFWVLGGCFLSSVFSLSFSLSSFFLFSSGSPSFLHFFPPFFFGFFFIYRGKVRGPFSGVVSRVVEPPARARRGFLLTFGRWSSNDFGRWSPGVGPRAVRWRCRGEREAGSFFKVFRLLLLLIRGEGGR